MALGAHDVQAAGGNDLIVPLLPGRACFGRLRLDDRRARRSAREEWQKRHDAVIASGGLHIVGTERHESRRIDNQLRGRSGRQGDPG